MNTIPIIKFMFSRKYEIMDDALLSHKEYAVVEHSAATDLLRYIVTIKSGIIIASLEDRNDLFQIATFMKLANKMAKEKILKIVVINFSRNKAFELAVRKIGILDILEADISSKAFKFKFDFWIRSLQAQLKSSASTNPTNARKNETEYKSSSNAQSIIWQNALELEDDIWIIEKDIDCRKVLTKWLISLVGPSPYASEWKEVKKNHWKFELTQDTNTELFVSGKGFWYFEGDVKPDFSWKDNTWLLSGVHVSLYYQDGTKITHRLQSQEKTLNICKNSLFANTKEWIIRETFNKDLYLKSQAQKLDNMSGESSTDHLTQDPLSGKGSTDKISNKNLSGAITPQEARQKSNESLAQKTSEESSTQDGANSGDASKQPKKTNTNFSIMTEATRGGEDLELATNEPVYKNLSGTFQESSSPDGRTADISIQPNNTKKDLSLKAETHKAGENHEMQRSDIEYEKYYKNHNSVTEYGTHQWNDHEKNGGGVYNPDVSTKEKTKAKNNLLSDEDQDNETKTEAELNIEEITGDAKVICYLKQNSNQIECILDDFFDLSIIFVSKENSLITSKTVEMNMNFKINKKNTFHTMSGLITSIEADGEGNYYINIQVTKQDSNGFGTFVSLYTLRQSNVNTFLKTAKGI